MNIIIAGAGEVGGHAAEILSSAGHNVTVVDIAAARLRSLDDTLDVKTLVGHCAHFEVLREAGAERCDLMIAATQVDEVNMLAASMAKAAGARKTIVRVHHSANFALRRTSYAGQLGIDELICPEHLTSLAIGRAIRNPGAIALEEFGRGKLIMQRFPVAAGAPAVGKKLSEIALPAKTRLATVESSSGYVIADANTTIGDTDFVTLIGETKSFEAARKLFSKGREKRRQIAIVGQGATAVWLCRGLKDRAFSVRLFVQDRKRGEELSEKLSHVTVIEADPTDATTFNDEHIEKADAFVAVLHEDEQNMLACAQAKALGAQVSMAVVQQSKFDQILEHVGVDYAFRPRMLAVNAMKGLIEVGPLRSVAVFADDTAEVFEIRPSKRAKVVGHELCNIRLPERAMIAAIRRGFEVYVPGADDQILADDVVLVIGPRGIEDDLIKQFVAK